MFDCKTYSTLVDTQAKISDNNTPVDNVTAYESLIGALQYLTFTRPDIAYTVQHMCLRMHNPWEPHLTAVKWILRYFRGSLDYGLLLRSSPTSELVVCTDYGRPKQPFPQSRGGSLGLGYSKWTATPPPFPPARLSPYPDGELAAVVPPPGRPATSRANQYDHGHKRAHLSSRGH